MKHLRRPRRQYRLVDPIQTLEPRTLLSYSVSDNSAVVLNTSLGEVVVQLDSNSPITTANFLSYVTAGSYDNTVFHRIAVDGQTQLNSQTETYSIVQGGGYTNDDGTFTAIATMGGLANGVAYTTIPLSGPLTSSTISSGAIATAGTTLTLVNNSDGNTQDVVLSSDADVGDTSLNVNSFTTDDAFPGGSAVENAGTAIGAIAGIENEASTSGNSNTVGTIAMARTSGSNSATSQFFFNVTDNSSSFDPDTAEGSAGYAVFGNVIRGLGIVDTIDSLSPQTVGNFDNVPELNVGTTGASPFVTINTATEEDMMTVTMGPNDAAGTHSVTFHDATNDASTTITLNGANSTLTFTGTNLSAHQFNGNLTVSGTGLQLDELTSSNTTTKSNLTFTSPGRTKHVDIGDIDITGSLHNISGSGINLTGDIDISGGLNQVKLLSSTAAGFLSIDSNSVADAAATTINIPFLSNISIQTGASIKELITRQYSVTDGTSRAVEATGDIDKVLVYGIMNAGINGNSVGSYKAGELTSYVAGQTTVGNVQISVFDQGEIYSGGAYNAKTIGIKNIKISGAMDGGEIIAAGNIGSVHASAMTDASIVAGYDTSGSLTALDGFQAALAANALIRSVSLKTPKGRNAVSFNDSQIQAAQIDSLHLGRIATTVPASASLSLMGIQTTDLKSLTAATDEHQSLHLSNIKSQIALNTVIAKNRLKLNPSAIVGSVATGTTTTAGLTAGDSYSSITLNAALATAIPAGTVVTIVSGSNMQEVTLSADANVTDTSLTVTPFVANATYAAGSTVQGTQTTTSSTNILSGDSYSSITLSSALATAIPSGTVVTLVSGSNMQDVTLSADASIGATLLTVTPFTANAEYDAGSIVQGTEVTTTTTGLADGDTYTALSLSDSVATALTAGSVITISDGTNTQTATLAANASVGDTTLTIDSFTASADIDTGATITASDGSSVGTLSSGMTTGTGALASAGSTPAPGTLGSSAAISPGLTSGAAYTAITLSSPVTAALAESAVLTLSSGDNSQLFTLAAAANVGDTSLSVTSFTANSNYPAGSTIQGIGFVIDIIPASDISAASS